jgi:hypothetical protein
MSAYVFCQEDFRQKKIAKRKAERDARDGVKAS